LSNGGYKITNVAKGIDDTDAVNVGQMNTAISKGNTDTHIAAGDYTVRDNKVTLNLVDKDGAKTGQVVIDDVASASDVGDVNNFHSNVKNKDGTTTSVVDAINNLDTTVTTIQTVAGQHSSVTNNDGNITIDGTDKNEAGGINYKINLNTEKIDLGKVTIQGNAGTITAQTMTAGKASMSDSGISYDGKTYIDSNGINANQQKITNVANGDITSTSTDAVNGSQLYETNQLINQSTQNYNSLQGSINKLGNRMNRIGAGAAALAALHPLDFDPDAKWDFAAGYGNYRNANAVAVGAYYRPNEDLLVGIGGSMGGGENMVNAGVSIKLGSGSSHVTTSRVAMAKEIVGLKENVAQLTALVNQLVGSQNRVQSELSKEFPDVPANHWAYEAVNTMASQGIIEGYPDGTFGGDRSMTRYEFATLVYRALQKGVTMNADISRLVSEFKPELDLIRIDTIAKDKAGNPTIERVRVNKTK
jgi:hypothetical protein